jgi:hypothetical protein
MPSPSAVKREPHAGGGGRRTGAIHQKPKGACPLVNAQLRGHWSEGISAGVKR